MLVTFTGFPILIDGKQVGVADDGWRHGLTPFAEDGDILIGPLPEVWAHVARDGHVVEFGAAPAAGGTVEANDSTLLSALLFPVLFAIAFTHCKNVSEEMVEPRPKLAKRYRKRHGVAPSTYRVLRIDPMREVLRTEGRSDEVGIKQALHICRGHFKTYDRKPLFGKVTGTYFWADHVRGDPKQGMVHKDYSIALPGDDGSIEVTVDEEPKKPLTRSSDAAHRQAVEAFSMSVAEKVLAGRFPGLAIKPKDHSNPGYDIEVRDGHDSVRYVEVKGTTREDPRFFISENERLFSLDHDDHYSLIVVHDIDLAAESYEVSQHEGVMDERFRLRPTQWEGVAPA